MARSRSCLLASICIVLPLIATSAAAKKVIIEDGNCLPSRFNTHNNAWKSIKLTECEDLSLQAAGGVGVPGSEKHEYILRGTCIRYDAQYRGEWVSYHESGRSFAEVSAKWDIRTNTFLEHIKFQGGTSGSISSKFKCASDPYLNNVNCLGLAHTNNTSWPSLSVRAYHCKTPFGMGKVNRQQAASMSQSAGSQPPPPPPKKPRKIDPSKVPLKRGIPRPGSTLKKLPDLTAKSYRNFSVARPNADVCKNACAREARCKSWTYRKPTRPGDRGQCFLSDRTPTPKRHPCCVSGVKRSRLRTVPRRW